LHIANHVPSISTGIKTSIKLHNEFILMRFSGESSFAGHQSSICKNYILVLLLTKRYQYVGMSIVPKGTEASIPIDKFYTVELPLSGFPFSARIPESESVQSSLECLRGIQKGEAICGVRVKQMLGPVRCL